MIEYSVKKDEINNHFKENYSMDSFGNLSDLNPVPFHLCENTGFLCIYPELNFKLKKLLDLNLKADKNLSFFSFVKKRRGYYYRIFSFKKCLKRLKDFLLQILKILYLKKNIANLNNLNHFINYFKESPKTYLIVILFSTIAGLFEIIGITSILPAISFYLGESNINMPSFIKELINTIGIEIILVLFVVVIIIQTFLFYISESYFLKKWVFGEQI